MFSQDSIAFLTDLALHNEKPWFEANKARYLHHVKEAAAEFSETLVPMLIKTYGGPVQSKLFRIHRDLRFSKDKTPYNAHIHLSFQDGDTGGAWMLALEPKRLVIGYGQFAFDKTRLDHWRKAVDGDAGQRLTRILAKAADQGLRIDAPELKRVPAPYDKGHPHAELLRRKGIALWQDDLAQDQAFGPKAPAQLAGTFRSFDPLREWLATELPSGG